MEIQQKHKNYFMDSKAIRKKERRENEIKKYNTQ